MEPDRSIPFLRRMIRLRHTARVFCALRQGAFRPTALRLCAGHGSARFRDGVATRRSSGARRSPIGWYLGCALAILLAWCGGAYAGDAVTVLNPTHDTYFGTRPSKPRGNSARLVVSQRYTTMLKFDLSEIPTSAVVHEAKLRLFVLGYKRGAGATTITAHEVQSAWDEHTATSLNRPPMNSVSESTNSVDATYRPRYCIAAM